MGRKQGQANLAKHHIEIVVVYVMRGKRRRLISAWRANCDERQDYTDHLRSADQGQH